LSNLVSRARRFLARTPRRTFVVYPALVILFETARRGSPLPQQPVFLPLLAWGFLQYWLTGEYRQYLRAGGRGFDKPPDRLLQSGLYAYTRNPMYLGHLIFMLGLALAFRSRLGWLILLANIPWFHLRVLEDEARLREKFGAEYEEYCARVRRWIPYIL
jgi:protein-S-isoprenylcysteine O-methyltransferase Ste14